MRCLGRNHFKHRLWLTAVRCGCQSPGNPAAAHGTSSQCSCVSIPRVTLRATVRTTKIVLWQSKSTIFGVRTRQVCSPCSIWASNQSVPTSPSNNVWPLYLPGISHGVLACCCKRPARLHTDSLTHIATRQRHSTLDGGKALYWGFILYRKSCGHQLYVTDEPFMSSHFQVLFE